MSADANSSELTGRWRRVEADGGPRIGEGHPTPTRQRRSPAGGRRFRFTLDLERGQHRFLKQFALDQEADASKVMRALLWLLEHDAQLGNVVRDELRAED